jgi:methylated-DNA-[protein]-cysteine S-methyltransferase
MAWDIYESPLGPLTLVGGEAGLSELHFPERTPVLDPGDRDPDALRDACDQLAQYFAGERRAFEIELDLSGTAFRRRVWRALRALPYGVVTTYGALAGARRSSSPATAW